MDEVEAFRPPPAVAKPAEPAAPPATPPAAPVSPRVAGNAPGAPGAAPRGAPGEREPDLDIRKIVGKTLGKAGPGAPLAKGPAADEVAEFMAAFDKVPSKEVSARGPDGALTRQVLDGIRPTAQIGFYSPKAASHMKSVLESKGLTVASTPSGPSGGTVFIIGKDPQAAKLGARLWNESGKAHYKGNEQDLDTDADVSVQLGRVLGYSDKQIREYYLTKGKPADVDFPPAVLDRALAKAHPLTGAPKTRHKVGDVLPNGRTVIEVDASGNPTVVSVSPKGRRGLVGKSYGDRSTSAPGGTKSEGSTRIDRQFDKWVAEKSREMHSNGWQDRWYVKDNKGNYRNSYGSEAEAKKQIELLKEQDRRKTITMDRMENILSIALNRVRSETVKTLGGEPSAKSVKVKVGDNLWSSRYDPDTNTVLLSIGQASDPKLLLHELAHMIATHEFPAVSARAGAAGERAGYLPLGVGKKVIVPAKHEKHTTENLTERAKYSAKEHLFQTASQALENNPKILDVLEKAAANIRNMGALFGGEPVNIGLIRKKFPKGVK